jgi:hypothetical protein
MKNVEFLTGTQISTRDGSEIASDLTYNFLEYRSLCVRCVRFEKPNKSDLAPFNHPSESFNPRYISARSSSLAASTYLHIWRAVVAVPEI